MTVLEKFLQFAELRPTDRLNSVEVALAEIMESYSDRFALTKSEQQIIDQRVAEARPEFTSSEDITKIFGQSFLGMMRVQFRKCPNHPSPVGEDTKP